MKIIKMCKLSLPRKWTKAMINSWDWGLWEEIYENHNYGLGKALGSKIGASVSSDLIRLTLH